MYDIRDREAGNYIVTEITLEEATATVAMYERQDKEHGIYTPDFYEIVERK